MGLPAELPIDGTKDVYVYLTTFDLSDLFGAGTTVYSTIYSDILPDDFGRFLNVLWIMLRMKGTVEAYALAYKSDNGVAGSTYTPEQFPITSTGSYEMNCTEEDYTYPGFLKYDEDLQEYSISQTGLRYNGVDYYMVQWFYSGNSWNNINIYEDGTIVDDVDGTKNINVALMKNDVWDMTVFFTYLTKEEFTQQYVTSAGQLDLFIENVFLKPTSCDFNNMKSPDCDYTWNEQTLVANNVTVAARKDCEAGPPYVRTLIAESSAAQPGVFSADTFISLAPDGEKMLVATAKNLSSGKVSNDSEHVKYVLDTVPPETTFSDVPTIVVNYSVELKITAVDSGSGISATQYCISSVGKCDPSVSGNVVSNGKITVDAEGQWTVCSISIDKALNIEDYSQNENCVEVQIDKTPPAAPVISSIAGGATSSGPISGTEAEPEVCGEAEPGSEITIFLRNVSGDTLLKDVLADQNGVFCTTVASLLPEGRKVIYAVSKDEAGNSGAQSLEAIYLFDSESPITTATGLQTGWSNNAVDITFEAHDAATGVKATYYCVDVSTCDPFNGNNTGTGVTISQEGEWVLCYGSEDEAGNKEISNCADIRIDTVAPIVPLLTTIDGKDWTQSGYSVASSIAAPLITGTAEPESHVNVYLSGGGSQFTPVAIEASNASQMFAYYQNPSASGVFEDDFEDGDYSTTWEVEGAEGNTSVSETGGLLQMTVGADSRENLISKNYYTIDGDCFAEVHFKVPSPPTDASAENIYFNLGFKVKSSDSDEKMNELTWNLSNSSSESSLRISVENQTVSSVNHDQFEFNRDYVVRFEYDSANKILKGLIDGNPVVTYSGLDMSGSAAPMFRVQNSGQGEVYADLDNFSSNLVDDGGYYLSAPTFKTATVNYDAFGASVLIGLQNQPIMLPGKAGGAVTGEKDIWVFLVTLHNSSSDIGVTLYSMGTPGDSINDQNKTIVDFLDDGVSAGEIESYTIDASALVLQANGLKQPYTAVTPIQGFAGVPETCETSSLTPDIVWDGNSYVVPATSFKYNGNEYKIIIWLDVNSGEPLIVTSPTAMSFLTGGEPIDAMIAGMDGEYATVYYPHSFAGQIPLTPDIPPILSVFEKPVNTNEPYRWNQAALPAGVEVVASEVCSLGNSDELIAQAETDLNGDYTAQVTKSLAPDGVKNIYAVSVDQADNKSTKTENHFYILDTVLPVTDVPVLPTGWSTTDVSLTLAAADGQSGVADIYTCVGVTECDPFTDGTAGAQITITTEGVLKICYATMDVAGNKEAVRCGEVKIDKTAPVTSVTGMSTGWSATDVSVIFTAADAQSGVAETQSYVVAANSLAIGTTVAQLKTVTTEELDTDEVEILAATEADGQSGVANIYSCIGETECDPFTDGIAGSERTITTEGVTKVCYASMDIAGNKEAVQCGEVKIDRTAPITEQPTLPQGWSNTDVGLTFTSEDELSGVDGIYSCVGTTECDPFISGTVGPQISVTAEGISKVCYAAVDIAGNRETALCGEVKIDKSVASISITNPPTAQYVTTDPQQPVEAVITDGLSGVDWSTLSITIDGEGALDVTKDETTGAVKGIPATVMTAGTKTARVSIKDIAGNYTESTIVFTLNQSSVSPECSFIIPQDGETLIKTEHEVEISAVGSMGISKVQFYYDGNFVADVPKDFDVYYRYEWNIANLPETAHYLKCVAYDTQGNTGDSTIKVYFKNTKAPIVKIVSPVNNSTVPATFDVKIEYSIDRGNVHTVMLLVDGAVVESKPVHRRDGFIIIPVTLAPGAHTLLAKASMGDPSAGHIGVSAPVSVIASVTPALKIMDAYNYPEPLSAKNGTHIYVELSNPADLKVYVKDKHGFIVKTIFISPHPRQSSYDILWDGKTQFGSYVSAGVYYVTVSATAEGATETKTFPVLVEQGKEVRR